MALFERRYLNSRGDQMIIRVGVHQETGLKLGTTTLPDQRMAVITADPTIDDERIAERVGQAVEVLLQAPTMSRFERHIAYSSIGLSAD